MLAGEVVKPSNLMVLLNHRESERHRRRERERESKLTELVSLSPAGDLTQTRTFDLMIAMVRVVMSQREY